MKKNIRKKENTLIFSLNPQLYSLQVIYGASYVFIDRAYILLDGDVKKSIKVFIKGKKRLSRKSLEALAGEFKNELLNYALREKLNQASRKIRECTIEKALAIPDPGILGQPQDYADYLKDPLGIAIPWEEKYGKRKAK